MLGCSFEIDCCRALFEEENIGHCLLGFVVGSVGLTWVAVAGVVIGISFAFVVDKLGVVISAVAVMGILDVEFDFVLVVVVGVFVVVIGAGMSVVDTATFVAVLELVLEFVVSELMPVDSMSVEFVVPEFVVVEFVVVHLGGSGRA